MARKARPDLKIEGPIQYDAAVDAGVAKTKMPGSDVAGRATERERVFQRTHAAERFDEDIVQHIIHAHGGEVTVS